MKFTKNDSIELVPYDPQWQKMAALEIKALREILPTHHIIDIQHVGSTAIPRMLAKLLLIFKLLLIRCGNFSYKYNLF